VTRLSPRVTRLSPRVTRLSPRVMPLRNTPRLTLLHLLSRADETTGGTARKSSARRSWRRFAPGPTRSTNGSRPGSRPTASSFSSSRRCGTTASCPTTPSSKCWSPSSENAKPASGLTALAAGSGQRCGPKWPTTACASSCCWRKPAGPSNCSRRDASAIPPRLDALDFPSSARQTHQRRRPNVTTPHSPQIAQRAVAQKLARQSARGIKDVTPLAGSKPPTRALAAAETSPMPAQKLCIAAWNRFRCVDISHEDRTAGLGFVYSGMNLNAGDRAAAMQTAPATARRSNTPSPTATAIRR
jgi:hypothetical protein